MTATHELGDLSDLAEGDIRCFGGIGQYGALVCRVEGRLFAVDDNCSQCDKPLSGGKLDAFHLHCLEHDDWFDVRDGLGNGHPAPAPIVCHALDGPEHAVRLREAGR